jgi:glycosyltransferase involved in cell wall biosynthesis
VGVVTGDRALVVLQLAANRWWTGSADPTVQLCRGLERRGHRVLLGLIRGDRFEEKARAAGLTPLAGLSLEARIDPRGVWSDLAYLRRLVRDERVDVIHAHHSHDHWLGWLCRGNAALVRTFHNSRAVGGGWPRAVLYRRSDAVIAVSEPIAARCLVAGIQAARLFRTEGVVEATRFAMAEGGEQIRKELGLGSGPVFGSVARLAANRGHEALIRGFALLVADRPDARLLLVGKGEARADIELLVTRLGLRPFVLLTGYRDGDLPSVLDALDVFVLMRAGSDESCRAALEAMAAGRPVVARRVGALPEAVVHGTTGLLVDDDRPESLAAALRELLEQPARARAMGEAGRARALEMFSPARHAEQVEAVYRAGLAARARR